MAEITLIYTIKESMSVKDFLKQKGFSDNNIYQEIANSDVLLNNQVVNGKNLLMKNGDILKVKLSKEKTDIIPKENAIKIVYEDDYFLIVDKPSCLHVEPYKKNTTNNLASYVAGYFIKNNIYSKVHIVNRLDKDTSGLVIICKNRYIKNLFKNIKIIKKYHAIVDGKIDDSGLISINISKEANSNSRIIEENGKESITKYRLLEYRKESNSSLAEVEILTGRTHQIRLSFLSISHPLCGDRLYNPNSQKDFFLRAYYLKFIHPITNKVIEIDESSKTRC